MLFFYFFIFYTKSQKIIHDCSSTYTDFNEFQNQSIELEVSCSENQIIHFHNINLIKSISVFEKSNVVLSCSPNVKTLNNISLYIFNNSQINFDDNCLFDYIEIYGFLTLKLLQNVHRISKNVILNDNTNQIEPTDMIYSVEKYENILEKNDEITLENDENDLKNDEIILTNIADDDEFICNNFFIVNFTDELHLECDQNNYTMNYSEISNYTFILNNVHFYINNLNFETSCYLENIVNRSTFSGQIDTFFVDIYNTTDIMNYAKMINCNNIQIWMKISWRKIMNNVTAYCEWEDEDYKEEFLDLKKHFDWLDENSDWRKVCYQNFGYLIHQETKGEVIVIPVASSWIICITIVLVIVGICISVFFISLYRFG